MSDFLLGAAGFVLLAVAVGLHRVLRSSDEVDRTLAVQLLGTGGIAALLMVAAATGAGGATDVALGLALLAAFAAVACVNGLRGEEPGAQSDDEPAGKRQARDP